MDPLTVYQIDAEGLRRLQEAIVLQAVKDYKDALDVIQATRSHAIREKAEIMARDCERFFRSEWFDMLTGGVDGEKAIEAIQKQMRGGQQNAQ